MTEMWKGAKHELAQFFSEPSLETLRDLIREHLGEADNLDFKWKWEKAPRLARHILAMANSGGGVIVIGVKEEDDGSYFPKGVEALADEADLRPRLDKFLPHRIDWTVFDFVYSSSEYPALTEKSFQVLVIEDKPQYIPFVSMAESGSDIRRNTIYVRSGKRSVKPSYEALQEVLNRRIETGYSSADELSLQEHLAQLKVLYQQIPKSLFGLDIGPSLSNVFTTRTNPAYPEEDFYEFIGKKIDEKKRLITQLITSEL